MTPREKLYHDALLQIAARGCASGMCGIIAQKALQKGRDEDVEQIITRGEQVVETFNKVFGKRD